MHATQLPLTGSTAALTGATTPTIDAGTLEAALLSGDVQQLTRALQGLRALDEQRRLAVLDALDPAAWQLLLEALAAMAGQGGSAYSPGGGLPRFSGAGSSPRAGGGSPRHSTQPRASTTTRAPTGAAPAMPGSGRTPKQLATKHKEPAQSAQVRMSPAQQKDAAAFARNYEQNKGRYEAVAQRTNMPPKLIAALHWRESTGNFGTYLHQGDPLGKPAVHVPKDIPVFHDWEDAAVHALQQKQGHQSALGLTKDSTDVPAMAAYAELYNGLGYHFRGRPSPYVYSGTDRYSSGKYVADGVYDARTVDQQLGVLALMTSI